MDFGEYQNPQCYSDNTNLNSLIEINALDQSENELNLNSEIIHENEEVANDTEFSNSQNYPPSQSENNNNLLLDEQITNETNNTEKNESNKQQNSQEESKNNDLNNETLTYHEMVELVGRLHTGCKRNVSVFRKVCGFLIDMVDIVEKNISSLNNHQTNLSIDMILEKLFTQYRNTFMEYKGIQENSLVLKAPDKIVGHQYASTKRYIPVVEQRQMNKRMKKTEILYQQRIHLLFHKRIM